MYCQHCQYSILVDYILSSSICVVFSAQVTDRKECSARMLEKFYASFYFRFSFSFIFNFHYFLCLPFFHFSFLSSFFSLFCSPKFGKSSLNEICLLKNFDRHFFSLPHFQTPSRNWQKTSFATATFLSVSVVWVLL